MCVHVCVHMHHIFKMVPDVLKQLKVNCYLLGPGSIGCKSVFGEGV